MTFARRTTAGFTFLEVLLALGMLLVGAVAILSLFAMGTRELVDRKVEARLQQVRREAYVRLQDAFDALKPGGVPPKIRDLPLSQPDFTLDADFVPSPFGGDRIVALATIKYQGTAVRALVPLPLTRSTFDPQSGGSP